jgi:MarR family transcriptional regulator, organic hydroperoxide resistance regulator
VEPAASSADRGDRVFDAFLAFTAEQNELSRTFARSNAMHSTDSIAIVAIIRAEERDDPLTPVRLADAIGLTGGATSILLNRLEGAGYVVRTRGHADRRMVTLHSTAAVHAIADAFFAPLRERVRAAMAAYSPAELDLIEQAATDLRRTMSSYLDTIGAAPTSESTD